MRGVFDLGLQAAGQTRHGIGDVDRRLGDEIDGADLERFERDLGAGLVSVETMITGIGRRVMIYAGKSRHPWFGISTSSVTTSGLSALICSRASYGSPAVPTTSISGSSDSSMDSQLPDDGGVVDDENPNRFGHVLCR